MEILYEEQWRAWGEVVQDFSTASSLAEGDMMVGWGQPRRREGLHGWRLETPARCLECRECQECREVDGRGRKELEASRH